MMRRLAVATAATIAAFPTFAADAGQPETELDGGCQVTAAYSAVFHREPAGDHWAWWVNQNETTGRLLQRMIGTPEGAGTIWTRAAVPHLAAAIDAACAAPHPHGWVDLGNGVHGPRELLAIRWCESRDDYTAKNPSSSAAGGWQFLTSTWRAVTGRNDTALHATPAEQDRAAVRLATMPGGGLSHWSCHR